MYRAVIVAVLMLFVGSSWGCSIATVHTPDSRDMACTTDNLAPAIDSVMALNSAAGAITLGASSEDTVQTSALGAVVVGGVYAYSAYTGFRDTSKCREHIHTEFDNIRESREVVEEPDSPERSTEIDR